MTHAPAPRPKTSASVFIGLWISLTVTAGLGTFALLFWAAGGFTGSSTAPTAASLLPSAAVIVNTSAAKVQSPQPTPQVTGDVTSTACTYAPTPASGFGYGIQSHVFGGGDPIYFLGLARGLGLNWVKIQVRWADLEKSPGNVEWGLLDLAMRAACQNGLRPLLSVVTAPDWTRAKPMPAPEGQVAPPDNPQLYADFLGKVLDRYPGQVGAIEVWNEENLEREWNTAPGIDVTEYLKLLQAAHATIKSKAPNVIVISGALSPTGINCNGTFPACGGGRPIIVDDASYLKQFVEAGGLNFADCVGTHSNGTNLPPDADGNNPPGDGSNYTFKGPWQNPHYSWALKSQVETYAQIINNQKMQCVTEFGYAAPMNGKYRPGFDFAADITEQQQGEYLVRAFDWMRNSGKVKLAFLFNLDYGQLGSGDPTKDDNMLFSLIDQQGAPRPAFDAIQKMPKP